MFSYTILFTTLTRFCHSRDHLQGVVKSEYKQYASDYIKCMRVAGTFYVIAEVLLVLLLHDTKKMVTRVTETWCDE